MSEHPMETTLRSALWRQFGAAIEMLEHALLACPSTLWTGLLWSDPEAPAYPTFWSLTHHTLFWLDLYLTGSLEGFAPPTPFTQDEFGPARVLPEQPYPKEELHAYLVQLRVARARSRCSRCQMSKRSARWLSPGAGGSR
jgi:hypothetical protein